MEGEASASTTAPATSAPASSSSSSSSSNNGGLLKVSVLKRGEPVPVVSTAPAAATTTTTTSSTLMNNDEEPLARLASLSLVDGVDTTDDETLSLGIDEEGGPPALDPVLQNALGNQRDRLLLLKTERELERFMATPSMTRLPMSPPYFSHMLNSYQRLLVHRLADIFGIHREVEALSSPTPAGPTGVVVLVKGPTARMPAYRLSVYLEAEASATQPEQQTDSPAETNAAPSTSSSTSNLASSTSTGGGGSTDDAPLPKFKILPRERIHRATSSSASSSNFGDDDRNKKALTLEEREAAYREARERIFKQQEREAAGESITRPHSASSSVSRRSAASTVSSRATNPVEYYHHQPQPYLYPHPYGHYSGGGTGTPHSPYSPSEGGLSHLPEGYQRHENWYAQKWVETPHHYYNHQHHPQQSQTPPGSSADYARQHDYPGSLRHASSSSSSSQQPGMFPRAAQYEARHALHASSSSSSLSAVSDSSIQHHHHHHHQPIRPSPSVTTAHASTSSTSLPPTSPRETSTLPPVHASLPAKPSWAASVTAEASKSSPRAASSTIIASGSAAASSVPSPPPPMMRYLPGVQQQQQQQQSPQWPSVSHANGTWQPTGSYGQIYRQQTPYLGPNHQYHHHQQQQGPPLPYENGHYHQHYPGAGPQLAPLPTMMPTYDHHHYQQQQQHQQYSQASQSPFLDDIPRPPPRKAQLFDPNSGSSSPVLSLDESTTPSQP